MALDAEQIIKRCFDSTKLALKMIDQGAATAPKPDNRLDAKQIIKRVYDNVTNSLQAVTV